MATKGELLKHVRCTVNVVRCIQVKRALTAVEPAPALSFWRLYYGIVLDIAVLEWCKIFGSRKERTHWTRVVKDQAGFRQALIQDLGVDWDTWKAYWKHLKAYRDNYVSHLGDIAAVATYPDLTLALASCLFYYRYLLVEVRRAGPTDLPDDLREYSEMLSGLARDAAAQALAATASLTEPTI